MPLGTRCPHCQKSMQVPDNAAGRNVRCPACRNPFTVPAGPSPRRRRQGEAPDRGRPAAKVVLVGGGLFLVLLLGGGLFLVVSGLGESLLAGPGTGKPPEKASQVEVTEGRTEKLKTTGKKSVNRTEAVIEDEQEEVTRIVLAQPVVHKITEEPDEGPPPARGKVEVVIRDDPENTAPHAPIAVDPTPRVKYALRT